MVNGSKIIMYISEVVSVISATDVAGTPDHAARKELAGPDLTAPKGAKRTETGWNLSKSSANTMPIRNCVKSIQFNFPRNLFVFFYDLYKL